MDSLSFHLVQKTPGMPKNPEDWLVSLDATPGAIGIMYTTWLNKYELLAPFGDLVSQK